MPHFYLHRHIHWLIKQLTIQKSGSVEIRKSKIFHNTEEMFNLMRAAWKGISKKLQSISFSGSQIMTWPVRVLWGVRGGSKAEVEVRQRQEAA